MKRIQWGWIGAFWGMLVLILDSKTAIYGAREGVALCLQSVIPSLFPFLVLTAILTQAMASLHIPLLGKLGHFLGIPRGTEGIFLTGLLGGYPTGARMVAKAWEMGTLNKQDAHRMLAFCSNAGPAFLFGILGSKFPEFWMLWLLWGIHILSAIIVAICLPGGSKQHSLLIPHHQITFTEAVRSALGTMGYICAWVVLFRVLLAIADRWILFLVPVNIRVVIYGILELTNGCCSLDSVVQDGLRFIICSGILAFGGICVAMQTASVTNKLGMGHYWLGKLLQSIISVIFAYLTQYFLFSSQNRFQITGLYYVFFPVGILLFVILVTKMKIRGRNPAEVGV